MWFLALNTKKEAKIFCGYDCLHYLCTMKATEQTIQQIERTLKKIAQKLPETDDPVLMTDIHLRVLQESGEILVFDDDDNEITRCVVEQWIDNKDENFYEQVTEILRRELHRLEATAGHLGILKPYSFVLEDDDHEVVGELFVADDETIILGGELMENMEEDLDSFFDNLMKE